PPGLSPELARKRSIGSSARQARRSEERRVGRGWSGSRGAYAAGRSEFRSRSIRSDRREAVAFELALLRADAPGTSALLSRSRFARLRDAFSVRRTPKGPKQCAPPDLSPELARKRSIGSSARQAR